MIWKKDKNNSKKGWLHSQEIWVFSLQSITKKEPGNIVYYRGRRGQKRKILSRSDLRLNEECKRSEGGENSTTIDPKRHWFWASRVNKSGL